MCYYAKMLIWSAAVTAALFLVGDRVAHAGDGPGGSATASSNPSTSASSGTAVLGNDDNSNDVDVTITDEYEDDTAAPTPPAIGSSHGCDVAGASTQVKGGGAGISIPTYPCDVLRTYESMEATAGRGPVSGTMVRFFLRARLVTRGIFSMVFGLFGLG